MKTLFIFSILILMIGTLAPALASVSEPVYETKCGQDAIDVGQLCMLEEKESAKPIKLLRWVDGIEREI